MESILKRLKTGFVKLITVWIAVVSLCSNVAGQDESAVKYEAFYQKEADFIHEHMENFKYENFLKKHRTDTTLIYSLLQKGIRVNDGTTIIRCNNLLGVIMRDKSRYKQAIDYHKTALEYAALSKDTLEKIVSLNNLGVVYRRLDKLESATEYHMQALNLSEKVSLNNDIVKQSVGVALNSIGNINLAQDDYLKAIDFFNLALEHGSKNDNKLGLAINLNNIGVAYEKMNKLDTALTYYNQSLNYNLEVESILGEAICYNCMGSVYLKKGENDKAIEYFNKTRDLSEEVGDRYYVTESYVNLGKAYLKIGQPKVARGYLEKALVLAREIGARVKVEASLRLLSEVYGQLYQYKKALKYYKDASLFHDSIMNARNRQHINDLMSKYEAERKELQIDQLNQEKIIQNEEFRQKKMFFYGFLGLLGAAIIIIIMTGYQRKLKDLHRQIQLEQRLLRSQMNPHFIFNCLITIQNFMIKEESENATFFLGEFSSLTRSVLEYSRQEFISLTEEVKMLEHYLKLQQMRFDFDYHISVDEEVNAEGLQMPPMLIQPFIENAINHGIRNIDYKGNVEVDIKKMKSSLLINVCDNGIGIERGKELSNSAHTSHAMNIFNERIQNYRKIYKNNINFEVKDLKRIDAERTGTLITFNVPLNWERK
ncbi:tetratricopeptide repeat protein [Puteibacter caeruleilacunae]|nr:tetratricopeptide repeat protein [Puteibacter caeruleilacunae]